MICYRDMTFCKEETCKNFGKDCSRSLTQEVRDKAEEWMKNPPFCVFINRPDCYEEKK